MCACSFVGKAEAQVQEAAAGLRGQIAADQAALGSQLGGLSAAAGASLQALEVGSR